MEQPAEQLTFDFDRVQPHIARESRDDIKLTLGAFSGPLDLLLFLIKQEQANIFDIPIARITDEYLKYIRLMKTLDISLAADFLVMAATLIEIKSKMLLPGEIADETEEEPEDLRRELIDRLLEHQKFKNAAEMLYERGTVEQAVFRRGCIESDENNTETNATVFDLLTVFQKILARHKVEVQMEIEREEMSLAEMLKQIKAKIFQTKQLNLLELFGAMRTRQELVLAFIAVLELVRTDDIKLLQSKTFGDIILTKI
ncbi:MAG: Segregation and condensation protein A [uncultured Pyrinomonadaceae bacterium]|uniref:Segregation and condensation protein A n=1 Tax=uncultured Pyrinomonadaceae bacterium TaxID=2283094 RepID=A0A6J4PZT6_9BACT|nr:MAG: Segregation and condensation protein A [uncultured Pyrinomonadaceae bacterium]